MLEYSKNHEQSPKTDFANKGRSKMKPSKLIFLLICLMGAALFAGCGGGNRGKGGNGDLVPEYTLKVTVEPEEAGEVLLEPSGGKYQKNTEVTLISVAGEGYEF